LLEDAMFQWQQREALSPHRKLSTIATLLIHWLYFHVLANLDTHPTSKFGNIMLASRVVHKKQMGQCCPDSYTITMELESLPFHIHNLE
jgi:hypothetical protein